MARVLVKTRKAGGSIIVSIPKEAAELEVIKEGGLIELEVRKPKRDWFGATKVGRTLYKRRRTRYS